MSNTAGLTEEAAFSRPQDLALEITQRMTGARLLVALVGAPGSGKSTLSDALRAELVERHGLSAEIVPMDGFHYDNAILDARGWRARKGAPHTFDADGLAATLVRLRQLPPSDIAVPVFDRKRDVSLASARIISKSVEVLLVEGNYLLLDQTPWSNLAALFDVTIKIDCPRAVLEQRLMARWLDLDMTEAEARLKVASNDLPNADLVLSSSGPADLTYRCC